MLWFKLFIADYLKASLLLNAFNEINEHRQSVLFFATTLISNCSFTSFVNAVLVALNCELPSSQNTLGLNSWAIGRLVAFANASFKVQSLKNVAALEAVHGCLVISATSAAS